MLDDILAFVRRTSHLFVADGNGMSAKEKLGAAAVIGLVVGLWLYACVSSGPGSDFDGDGLKDKTEDRNGNFAFDPGESDFLIPDTDSDGLYDGQPPHPRTTVTRAAE